jgi:hypothetical protein
MVDKREMSMAAATKARVVVDGNSGVIRVHVSAETLYNLGATQELTKRIMGLVGHPGCCSGRQLIFQQEESEFTV